MGKTAIGRRSRADGAAGVGDEAHAHPGGTVPLNTSRSSDAVDGAVSFGGRGRAAVAGQAGELSASTRPALDPQPLTLRCVNCRQPYVWDGLRLAHCSAECARVDLHGVLKAVPVIEDGRLMVFDRQRGLVLPATNDPFNDAISRFNARKASWETSEATG